MRSPRVQPAVDKGQVAEEALAINTIDVVSQMRRTVATGQEWKCCLPQLIS